MASSSSSKSLEKKMNLKLKEKPFNFAAGASSSSSLKSKDVTKMKNLKIQEKTVVTPPESDSDDQPAGGGSQFEGGSSSSGKKKAKSQSKRKQVQIPASTATATRKKTRFSSTTTTTTTSSSSKSSSSSSTMVLLRSSDGDIFEVEESIALLSQTITHMIEDGVVAGNVITLSNISSEILEKVIGFLEKHVGDEENRDYKEKEELKKWDEEYAEKLKKDQYTLFELILAANYLTARCLLDVTCQACADMIKGMTPEQIRKFFNIKNDFSPEEEAEVRRENQWAFE